MTEKREAGAPPAGYRYRVRDAIKALRREPPPLGSDAPPPIPGEVADEESIAWMLIPAEAHLRTQRMQLDSLIARAIQLAGFSAVLLGLLAAFVSDRLDQASGCVEILAKGAFVSALALLVAGILIALLWVARPTRGRRFKEAEHIAGFLRSEEQMAAKPWKLQLAYLRAYPELLAWYEWLQARRAAALFLAYNVLAFGVFASAACIGTLGLSD